MDVHQCHAAGPGDNTGAVARKQGRTLRVDVHAHALVPEVEALVKGRPEKQAEHEAHRRTMGVASADYNATTMRPTVYPKLTSIEQRMSDMDAMGIDVQVISPTSLQHYYWADYDLARQIVRVNNEKLAEQCAKHPDRLVALGNVALQHPALAVEQLQYSVRELGLRGVEISTSVNGVELDDPALDPFWAKAEALGCVVFIHPSETSSLGERLNRFYLQNIVGRPMETTIALSHLIFGGVLDRRPGLKILAAHGGGYLPFYAGRSDHGHAVRPECQAIAHPPSEYLRRIYFDTLVYAAEGLRALVTQVGAGQVVLGTDYPFDMGDYDVERTLREFSDGDRDAMLSGNAVRLFDLEQIAARKGER
jgi:aminocarboxymuconate-semialdehyde decarboxylase